MTDQTWNIIVFGTLALAAMWIVESAYQRIYEQLRQINMGIAALHDLLKERFDRR